MRSDLELLEIVRDNFDEYFCFGLYVTTSHLVVYNQITPKEEIILDAIFSENGYASSQDKNYCFDLLNRLIEHEKLKEYGK